MTCNGILFKFIAHKGFLLMSFKSTVSVFRRADQCHEEGTGKVWNSNASF